MTTRPAQALAHQPAKGDNDGLPPVEFIAPRSLAVNTVHRRHFITGLAATTLMPAALKKSGVPHQLHTINKGEHGLAGGDPEQIRAAYDAIVPFLSSHVPN